MAQRHLFRKKRIHSVSVAVMPLRKRVSRKGRFSFLSKIKNVKKSVKFKKIKHRINKMRKAFKKVSNFNIADGIVVAALGAFLLKPVINLAQTNYPPASSSYVNPTTTTSTTSTTTQNQQNSPVNPAPSGLSTSIGNYTGTNPVSDIIPNSSPTTFSSVYNPTPSSGISPLGSPTNPYNYSGGWQGAGYYTWPSVLLSMPGAGIIQNPQYTDNQAFFNGAMSWVSIAQMNPTVTTTPTATTPTATAPGTYTFTSPNTAVPSPGNGSQALPWFAYVGYPQQGAGYYYWAAKNLESTRPVTSQDDFNAYNHAAGY